jgi:hypothetical protein
MSKRRKPAPNAAEPDKPPPPDPVTDPYARGYWDADNVLSIFGMQPGASPVSEFPPSRGLLDALCWFGSEMSADRSQYREGFDERMREHDEQSED